VKFFLKGVENRFSRKLLETLEKEYSRPPITETIVKFMKQYVQNASSVWADGYIERTVIEEGICLSGSTLEAEALLRGVYCVARDDSSWIEVGDGKYYGIISGQLCCISDITGSVNKPNIVTPIQIFEVRTDLQLDYERRVCEILSL
jgi:hypothetical protein